MMVLQSDDETIYLINCVDRNSFLEVGFFYADPQSSDVVTVGDESHKFKVTLPDAIKQAQTFVTGVNFKFNYGN